MLRISRGCYYSLNDDARIIDIEDKKEEKMYLECCGRIAEHGPQAPSAAPKLSDALAGKKNLECGFTGQPLQGNTVVGT